jgi:hypothetical protein
MLTGASFFGSCGTSTRKPLDRLRGAQFVREQRTRKRLGARAGRPLPAVGRQPRETNWPGAPQVRRAPRSSLALWMVPRGGVYGSRRSSARPGESWATEGALGRWSFRLPTGRSCALKGVRGVFVGNPAAAPARDRRRECEQHEQDEGRAGVVPQSAPAPP